MPEMQLLALSTSDAETLRQAMEELGVHPLASERIALDQDPLPAMTRLMRAALLARAAAEASVPPADEGPELVIEDMEPSVDASVEGAPMSSDRDSWVAALEKTVDAEPPAPARLDVRLEALGVTVEEGTAELPPGFELAAAQDVLSHAELHNVRIDGRPHVLASFPGLGARGARMLLLTPGDPTGEVLVVHRQPRKVGLCKRGGGLLHSTGRLTRTAIEVTGQDYPGRGRLFAVLSDAVLVLDDRHVWRWDGRRRTFEGPPGSVVASLLLEWLGR